MLGHVGRPHWQAICFLRFLNGQGFRFITPRYAPYRLGKQRRIKNLTKSLQYRNQSDQPRHRNDLIYASHPVSRFQAFEDTAMDHYLTEIVKNKSRRCPAQKANQSIPEVVLPGLFEPLLRPRQINLWIQFLVAGRLTYLACRSLAGAVPPEVRASAP